MTDKRQVTPDNAADTAPASGRMRGFTEGSVGRHLTRLGLYMAGGSVAMNISMFAEAFYLGLIGTQALAAMGVAFPVTITLFAFAGGIGTGASSVTARTMGAGDRDHAALLITHAQLLAVVIGIVLGTLGVVFAQDIVTLIGAQGELRRLTVEYLTVYLLGFPAFMLSIVGSTLLRATGNARSPGIIMAVGSALQILLGPPLIFGWFGIPALGIAGAAWAYVLSRTIGMLLYVYLLVRARMLRWSFAGMLDSWRRILHVGGPAVASGLVMPAGMLAITKMLLGHGEAVVAAYNVASRVETLAHMILWSVSSSVEPFVGQNWGARLHDRVKRALSLTHRFSLGWGVITFVFMVLFGRHIVAIVDDDPTVIEVATYFFYIIPLTIGFMGMTQIASACFNALGKPTPSLVISFLRAIGIGLPLAIVGNYLWGYIGIFISTAVTNVLLGLLAWQWNWRTVDRLSAEDR